MKKSQLSDSEYSSQSQEFKYQDDRINNLGKRTGYYYERIKPKQNFDGFPRLSEYPTYGNILRQSFPSTQQSSSIPPIHKSSQSSHQPRQSIPMRNKTDKVSPFVVDISPIYNKAQQNSTSRTIKDDLPGYSKNSIKRKSVDNRKSEVNTYRDLISQLHNESAGKDRKMDPDVQYFHKMEKLEKEKMQNKKKQKKDAAQNQLSFLKKFQREQQNQRQLEKKKIEEQQQRARQRQKYRQRERQKKKLQQQKQEKQGQKKQRQIERKKQRQRQRERQRQRQRQRQIQRQRLKKMQKQKRQKEKQEQKEQEKAKRRRSQKLKEALNISDQVQYNTHYQDIIPEQKQDPSSQEFQYEDVVSASAKVNVEEQIIKNKRTRNNKQKKKKNEKRVSPPSKDVSKQKGKKDKGKGSSDKTFKKKNKTIKRDDLDKQNIVTKRSKRNRTRPLEYWKNEKIIYKDFEAVQMMTSSQFFSLLKVKNVSNIQLIFHGDKQSLRASLILPSNELLDSKGFSNPYSLLSIEVKHGKRDKLLFEDRIRSVSFEEEEMIEVKSEIPFELYNNTNSFARFQFTLTKY